MTASIPCSASWGPRRAPGDPRQPGQRGGGALPGDERHLKETGLLFRHPRGDQRRRRRRPGSPSALPDGRARQPAVPGDQRQRQRHQLKFDNLYGCRESLVDAIRRATDVIRWRARSRWSAATAMSASRLPAPAAPGAIVTEVDNLRPAGGDARSRPSRTRSPPTSSSPPPATRMSSPSSTSTGDGTTPSSPTSATSIPRSGSPAQLQVGRDQAAGPPRRVSRRQEDRRPKGAGEPRQRHRPSSFRHELANCTRPWPRSSFGPACGSYPVTVHPARHLDEKVATLHLAKLGAKPSGADDRPGRLHRASRKAVRSGRSHYRIRAASGGVELGSPGRAGTRIVFHRALSSRSSSRPERYARRARTRFLVHSRQKNVGPSSLAVARPGMTNGG